MNDFAIQLAHVRPTIAYRFKAFPGQGQSLNELVEKMHELGNSVLDVNREKGFILVGQKTETDDRWGCLLCLQTGVLSMVDTENELRDHLDLSHPGWEANERGEPVA